MTSKIGTFHITQTANGRWTVKDSDNFNNYGVKSGFTELALAEDYAQRCHDFKQGRRLYI